MLSLTFVLSIALSFFVGNGFNPLFTFFGIDNKKSFLALAILLVVKSVFDLNGGYFYFIFFSYYVALLIAALSSFILSKVYQTSYVNVFVTATAFYLVSNTVCAFTMPDYYTPNLQGILASLIAGYPYYLRSLLASTSLFFIFKFVRYLSESLSFSTGHRLCSYTA